SRGHGQLPETIANRGLASAVLLKPATQLEIAAALFQRLGDLRIRRVVRSRPIARQNLFGLAAIHAVLSSLHLPSGCPASGSAAIARSRARSVISPCPAELRGCRRFLCRSGLQDRKERAAPGTCRPVVRATATPCLNPGR